MINLLCITVFILSFVLPIMHLGLLAGIAMGMVAFCFIGAPMIMEISSWKND